jgi:hypothetical protein
VAHITQTLQGVIMDHCKTVIEVLKERLPSVDGEGRHHHRAADVLSTVRNMLDTHVYGYTKPLYVLRVYGLCYVVLRALMTLITWLMHGPRAELSKGPAPGLCTSNHL